MTKFEWRKRHEFHEFAETLGVETDEIMAMNRADLNSYTVLYTKSATRTDDLDSEPLYVASMFRSRDGVLEVLEVNTVGTLGELKSRLMRNPDQGQV